MIWVSITVSVLVSLAACTLYVHLWRRRIRRDMETDAIIGKLRREVGEIVTELNGTTERNVALLENRIAAMSELVDRAGKTSGVLKRESEKHEISNQVYTALERSRPLAPSLNLDVVDSGSASSGSGNPAKSAGTAESDVKETDFPNAGAGSIDVSSGELLTADDATREDAVDFNSLSDRDKALVMHRNGDSPDKIGSALGLSLGEVELIISIYDRKVY